LKSPEYATLRTISPLSLPQIQRLLDDQSIILEYFICKDKTLVWTISRSSFSVTEIPIESSKLIEKVKLFREPFDLIKEEDKKLVTFKDKEGADLYSLLIEKVEEKIKDKRLLYIVPHGILHYLPFQALIDKRGKYLIETYQITNLPSASILKFCQERNLQTKKKLLAFGWGNLETPEYLPLLNTKLEIEKLKEIFPKSKAYLEEEFTMERVRKEAGQSDLIHFATHGVLDPDAPLFSALILADGRLEAHEIFSLDIRSYLVTLSACETGLGKVTAGDEVVGLTTAFIYAGASSIVVSLWCVDDVSTSILMRNFYKNLRDGMSKTEALQRAQLFLMKTHPHPFYWTPFILVGDWR